MGRKPIYSKVIEIQACNYYLSEKECIIVLSQKLNIHKRIICTWINKYRQHCSKAFDYHKRNKSYSKTFKEKQKQFKNSY